MSWDSLGFADYGKLLDEDEQKKQANELWKKISIVINGIGNLSLSTISYNSSDSNGLPIEHIDTYEKCGLVETAKQVRTWTSPEDFVSKINERSENVMEFILENIIHKNDIWN